jgi:hypothetical protein
MGAAVIVIFVEIVVYIYDYFVGAGNLDARFRVVKADDPVGVCIVFVTAANGIVRYFVTVAAAIVLVDISAVGRHRHVRRVALYDYHFFHLRFGFFLNRCRRLPGRIGVNIVPFLGEAEQRHGCQ